MIDHLIFDTTSAATMADTHSVGAYLRDSLGNLITSQANGSQRALDVGINVAGVQIDPRQIRALTNADVVTVEQGTSPWVVSATNLDIRDLTHVSDSIKIGDGVDFLAINADGSINVNADISVTNGAEKAEDSAHVSADIGQYVLAVRQDAIANSVSADGDYASLKVDAVGALYVYMTNTISVNDAALANSTLFAAAETGAAINVSKNAVAAPLSARKYLWIYNNDNQKMYIGGAGVTTASGFPVSPGAYAEMRAGAAVDVEFVSAKASHLIRTLELS